MRGLILERKEAETKVNFREKGFLNVLCSTFSASGNVYSRNTLLRNPASPLAPPPLTHFLQVWLVLGFQSFGGGATTLTLIRRKVVEQQGWLCEAEFTRDWALVQIVPGINLLGLTILIGRRVAGGWRGAMLALIAINLPPLLVLMVDQLYRRVKNHPAVEGFVRGLSLAVVGIFGMVQIGLIQNFGVDTRSMLLATAAIGLGLTRRVPVFGIIALAALVGSVAR